MSRRVSVWTEPYDEQAVTWALNANLGQNKNFSVCSDYDSYDYELSMSFFVDSTETEPSTNDLF